MIVADDYIVVILIKIMEELNFEDFSDLMAYVIESDEDGDYGGVSETVVDESRFGKVSDEEINYIKNRQFSDNTAKKIVMVRKLFMQWVKEKNASLRLSLRKVPVESLDTWTDDDLNHWLPYFVAEIRNQKKEHYRARTILEYVMMLQAHCQAHGRNVQFLRDIKFASVRNAVENVMKARQKEGLGYNPSKASTD